MKRELVKRRQTEQDSSCDGCKPQKEEGVLYV